MTKQKFGLTGTALKTIALVLMVMDHIHYFFEFYGCCAGMVQYAGAAVRTSVPVLHC